MTSVILLMVAVTAVAQALPSLEFADDHIKRWVQSDEVDGYDIAEVYAVDTATNTETRQTKRDIEAQGSESSLSSERHLSLRLASGEGVRLTVERRALANAGAKYIVIDEEGERERTLPKRDCYFEGRAEGGVEGIASISMCDGKLIGTILTSKRAYEILTLRHTDDKRDADDAMRVLVAWKNSGRHRRNDKEDVEDAEDVKRQDEGAPEEVPADYDELLLNQTAAVELSVYMDKFHINKLKNWKNYETTDEFVDHVLRTWRQVGWVLHDDRRTGWQISIKVVKVVIMFTHPEWYKPIVDGVWTKPGKRMAMLCTAIQNDTIDHAFLLTNGGPGPAGTAWLGGICNINRRCAVGKSGGGVTLHEFGHNLGLHHDAQMSVCKYSELRKEGFMQKSNNYFRPCYNTVLDTKLARSGKQCLFRQDHSEYLAEYPRNL